MHISHAWCHIMPPPLPALRATATQKLWLHCCISAGVCGQWLRLPHSLPNPHHNPFNKPGQRESKGVPELRARVKEREGETVFWRQGKWVKTKQNVARYKIYGLCPLLALLWHLYARPGQTTEPGCLPSPWIYLHTYICNCASVCVCACVCVGLSNDKLL